ncbi:MAG TPA: flavin reductase family protein [Candidatus Polarisedimenticolaceae bacterium]|nr:flavin reductase family protein [Candidatus Polarisedimenticolaceae bacterium]
MRVPVPLRRAYKLINHGPTTLVTSAAGGRRNVMAAAWVMGLDYDPPRVAAVIASGTFTRQLVEASGELVVNVPTAAMLDTVYAVGQATGEEIDKFAEHGLAAAPASVVSAPLLEGCAAWLECRVVPEPAMQERYDLFVADVLAAWADDASFVDGLWRFASDDRRTLHHLSAGVFMTSGDLVKAKSAT